jgi:cytochrome c peroxidase
LRAADFPLHAKLDPVLFTSPVMRDSNDVVSSQGVHFSDFVDSSTRSPVDESIPLPDPDGYQVAAVNTRRAAPRNTPTVINAAFNHRQFWDGRAQNVFNGVNSLGDRDPFAFVYKDNGEGTLEPTRVRLENASLASQALEPPLSSIEQSADGRTWSEIGESIVGTRAELPRNMGRRSQGLRPLAQQLVHPEDSVLGEMSGYPRPGLDRTYDAMIRQSFQPEWWASKQLVRVNEDGSRTIIDNASNKDDNTYSQMEMNFSLFFGLAVQLYEATLVADDTPVDRFLDGDETALTESELIGFFIADGEGRCINCHGGPELTFASVTRINQQGPTRVRKGDLIDEGYNNIGVRPTLEDLGVGGMDALGNPLGFARMTQLGLTENPNIDDAEEQAADLGDDGAFKIPGLRNVELTAPYFHNGGEATLEDVIDFYFRGGNFRNFDPEKGNPIIGYDANRVNESEITGLGVLRGELLDSGPGLDDEDKANLVAFLRALTDERVRLRKAPFDHPQLFIPNGHPGDQMGVTDDGTGNATDEMLEIPAVGAKGGDPLPTFSDNLAF